MKEAVTKKLSAQALNGLIEYCQNNRGVKAGIVERLAMITGQKQYRQNLEEYLSPDPKTRVEPRLGLGLALLIVAAEFCGPLTINEAGISTKGKDGEQKRERLPVTAVPGGKLQVGKPKRQTAKKKRIARNAARRAKPAAQPSKKRVRTKEQNDRRNAARRLKRAATSKRK